MKDTHLYIGLVIAIVLYVILRVKEKYDYQQEYQYAMERGNPISGTVYAGDYEAPGMGWIL